MSVEYIKRITVKKDGVYLCTKSSNDSIPYRSVRIDSLSEIYREKGQEGLDKELIGMFLDYCVPKGDHKSVLPFKKIHSDKRAVAALTDWIQRRSAEYHELSDEDKQSNWIGQKTPAMEQYLERQKQERQKYIDVLYERLLSERKKEEEK